MLKRSFYSLVLSLALALGGCPHRPVDINNADCAFDGQGECGEGAFCQQKVGATSGLGICTPTTIPEPHCDQFGSDGQADCDRLNVTGSVCGAEVDNLCSKVVNSLGCGFTPGDGTPHPELVADGSGNVCGSGFYCQGTGDPVSACASKTVDDNACDGLSDVPGSGDDDCEVAFGAGSTCDPATTTCN